jgi:prolyl-tRNA editing enzyme YbaK/EbsC (Cys-tRNA(Pro) deacylase)
MAAAAQGARRVSDASLPPSAARVQAAADRLGLRIAVREMPASTRTAEEAAAACGCEVGQIAKSLVFAGKDSGRPYLLLVSGKNRVDEKGVAGAIGERLTRPDAAAVRAWTGFAIGGIPPFGHDTEMPTFIDRDLLAYDVVWAAAGTPSAVFSVAPAALARAVGGRLIAVV